MVCVEVIFADILEKVRKNVFVNLDSFRKIWTITTSATRSFHISKVMTKWMANNYFLS